MNAKFYGVDVSKDKLDIACNGKVVQIQNTKRAIKSFVKAMDDASFVVLEATNIYHLQMADTCYLSGVKVFVVNPRITRRYREANGYRGKNDRMDALTLARYIEREHDVLREYVPLSDDQRRLRILIRRRCKLVGMRTQLVGSLGGIKEIGREYKALVARIDSLIAKLELLIDKHLESNDGRSRISTIKGIGPVVSAVLVSDLDAHKFTSADAFVAYYGLDATANDSGKRRGERKLSKQGQRLGRAMLYNAAMAAVTSKVWRPLYERCVERGLKRVQALIVVARKLARCAWSIYTHKTVFAPERVFHALT